MSSEAPSGGGLLDPCSGPHAGWVVGESTPVSSVVLFDRDSKVTPASGLYVTVETGEGCVLGIVEWVSSGNTLLPEDVTDSDEVKSVTRYRELLGRSYTRGRVRWLTLTAPLLAGGKIRSPREPPRPGSEVRAATPSLLDSVFRGGRGWVRLGRLRGTDVAFHVSVNQLFRHLAVLAVTGGGKSNTVCVLAQRIVGDLGGTMVIFDVHGEYASARGLAPGRVNVQTAKINPVTLTLDEILRLARFPEHAIVQERILRKAWEKAMSEYLQGSLPATKFLSRIEELARSPQVKRDAGYPRDEQVLGVLSKLEDVRSIYGDVLDPNYFTRLEDIIKPGKLTVIDLSEVDENGADAVVSHYLRLLLMERKRWRRSGGSAGYPSPVIAVIEEAHVLVPREEDTLTKRWAARVAREGRKFGVGLALVSQRPKGLDPDVLSQTNNKIILRIVEPSDIRYVQAASEQLSEDLASVLPALSPGEAVVIGSIARLPAIVQVDKCPAETGGTDIDAVGEWARLASQGGGEEDLSGLLSLE
ncbi:MAG: ATP-binding protein [Desulfurococcales archaeon]|nr:ATP-binding protein [Desulfurococcales archaeon]